MQMQRCLLVWRGRRQKKSRLAAPNSRSCALHRPGAVLGRPPGRSAPVLAGLPIARMRSRHKNVCALGLRLPPCPAGRPRHGIGRCGGLAGRARLAAFARFSRPAPGRPSFPLPLPLARCGLPGGRPSFASGSGLRGSSFPVRASVGLRPPPWRSPSALPPARPVPLGAQGCSVAAFLRLGGAVAVLRPLPGGRGRPPALLGRFRAPSALGVAPLRRRSVPLCAAVLVGLRCVAGVVQPEKGVDKPITACYIVRVGCTL